MNQSLKNKINELIEFVKNNVKLITSVLLSIHILIGLSFLLYNHYKDDKIKYRYEIETKDTTYKSNEVYLGEDFILFFDGGNGVYENNEETIKIYNKYHIDTIGDKIKIKVGVNCY